MLKLDQKCFDVIGHDSEFIQKWDELIHNMYPKENEYGTLYKHNIGIFENIPDRENDPDERYASETFLTDDDVYPDLKEDVKKHSKNTAAILPI